MTRILFWAFKKLTNIMCWRRPVQHSLPSASCFHTCVSPGVARILLRPVSSCPCCWTGAATPCSWPSPPVWSECPHLAATCTHAAWSKRHTHSHLFLSWRVLFFPSMCLWQIISPVWMQLSPLAKVLGQLLTCLCFLTLLQSSQSNLQFHFLFQSAWIGLLNRYACLVYLLF